MTVDMGYEPRTKTAKAMYQEETQEVLVVQTRTRESKYIKSKSKYKTTPANTALRNTTSGLMSGAEQIVGDRNRTILQMTTVISARFTISGTKLGLDRAAATNPMTIKMATTTSTGTGMVTEHAVTPIATQSPTRKALMIMSSYTCKIGFIDVRFMCGSGRGFDIARVLKEFMNAARRHDDEFSIFLLHGSGNNICNAIDLPGSREDIERYY
jgi:hypothetical protein